MKDIKSYIIGFLTCACLFLIMGQMPTMGDEQIKQMKNMAHKMKNAGFMPEPVGRYQGLSVGKKKEQVMLIDTQTGDLYELMGVSDKTIWRGYQWHGQSFIKWQGLDNK